MNANFGELPLSWLGSLDSSQTRRDPPAAQHSYCSERFDPINMDFVRLGYAPAIRPATASRRRGCGFQIVAFRTPISLSAQLHSPASVCMSVRRNLRITIPASN